MKKLTKFLVPGILLLALLVAFYFLFMRPTGFTSPESVVEEYVNTLNNDECETYFNSETILICEQFISLLEDETVSIKSTSVSNNTVTVVLLVNDLEATFDFEVISVEPSTLRGVFTKSYYIIDDIK